MSQIGASLNDEEMASLPEDQQGILKAFFQEADANLESPDALEMNVNGMWFAPPQSLQEKYDTIVGFGGDQYCPVRQCVQRFAFKKTEDARS